MYDPESNRDRLQEAGILDSTRELSPEENNAIDSLTPEEVGQLIDINDKLRNQIPEADPVLVFPGINPIGQE